MTVVAGGEAGRGTAAEAARPGQRAAGWEQAALDRGSSRSASSSMPRRRRQTSMTTVAPAARPRRSRSRAALAGGDPLLRRLAAVVDGVGDEVLAARRRRRRARGCRARRPRPPGPAARPCRSRCATSRTSWGTRRRPGGPAPSPGPSRRRGRRRAGRRVLDAAAQLAGRRLHLVADATERVDRRVDIAGRLSPLAATASRRARSQCFWSAAKRDRRGRGARPGGPRARPRRRRRAGRGPGGRDAHRLAGARRPARRPARRRRRLLLDRRRARARRPGPRRRARGRARRATAARSSGSTGCVGAGHRAADAVGGGEQQVDEVACGRQPAVAQRAEQVLGRGGRVRATAVEAQHAGRALDGVRVAEQTGDELARRAVRLELRAARRTATRAVPRPPRGRSRRSSGSSAQLLMAGYATRNCAIDARSSAASDVELRGGRGGLLGADGVLPGHVGDLGHRGHDLVGGRPLLLGRDRDLLGGGGGLVDHAGDPLERVDDVAGQLGAGVDLLGALLAGEDRRVGLGLDLRRRSPGSAPADSCERSASLRTSEATTAKPRPCSPARAASMAALRASRLVWSARSSMTSRMRPISWLFSPRDSARVAIESTRSAMGPSPPPRRRRRSRPSSA